MNQKALLLILLLLPISGYAQEIVYASSIYRSTAGPIGPDGVQGTDDYYVQITGMKSLVLDSLVVYKTVRIDTGLTALITRLIPNEPMKWQSKDDTLHLHGYASFFTLTHQRGWKGKISDDTITISAKADHWRKENANEGPAITLYGQYKGKNVTLQQGKFDVERRIMNK